MIIFKLGVNLLNILWSLLTMWRCVWPFDIPFNVQYFSIVIACRHFWDMFSYIDLHSFLPAFISGLVHVARTKTFLVKNTLLCCTDKSLEILHQDNYFSLVKAHCFSNTLTCQNNTRSLYAWSSISTSMKHMKGNHNMQYAFLLVFSPPNRKYDTQWDKWVVLGVIDSAISPRHLLFVHMSVTDQLINTRHHVYNTFIIPFSFRSSDINKVVAWFGRFCIDETMML